MNSDALLDVRDVALRFGGIIALDGVSFELEEGQILGLIGPNGAGKTTLFNCFSRLYTPNRGDIIFAGRSLLERPPHRIGCHIRERHLLGPLGDMLKVQERVEVRFDVVEMPRVAGRQYHDRHRVAPGLRYAAECILGSGTVLHREYADPLHHSIHSAPLKS